MSLLNPFADQAAAFNDEELLRAYQQTDGEPGDDVADTLLAEIERRGLDV